MPPSSSGRGRSPSPRSKNPSGEDERPMATVSPFRAIHYDPAKVGDLTKVVAPPYDVISPEEQVRLHERHPKNIVHVDFGLEKPGDDAKENKYSRAARYYEEWLRE